MNRSGIGRSPSQDTAPTNVAGCGRYARWRPHLDRARGPGAPEKRPTPVDVPGVTANLGEWNWKSVGQECSTLADTGYTGVQVAPPQNSLKRTELGNGSDTILHPWWEDPARRPCVRDEP